MSKHDSHDELLRTNFSQQVHLNPYRACYAKLNAKGCVFAGVGLEGAKFASEVSGRQ